MAGIRLWDKRLAKRPMMWEYRTLFVPGSQYVLSVVPGTGPFPSRVMVSGPFRFWEWSPFEVAGDRSLEPERERERPTATEVINGRDLSLGRCDAGVPGLGLGLRGLLAGPVTQANGGGDSLERRRHILVDSAVKRRRFLMLLMLGRFC